MAVTKERLLAARDAAIQCLIGINRFAPTIVFLWNAELNRLYDAGTPRAEPSKEFIDKVSAIVDEAEADIANAQQAIDDELNDFISAKTNRTVGTPATVYSLTHHEAAHAEYSGLVSIVRYSGGNWRTIVDRLRSSETRNIDEHTLYKLVRLEHSLAVEAAQPDDPPKQTEEPQPPKQYLTGWEEIFDALGLVLSKSEQRKKSRKIYELSESYNGPLKRPGQGCSPHVGRDAFVNWWNSIEDRRDELHQRTADRDFTLSSGYTHGRKAEVVLPGIAGAEKKRREPTKVDQTSQS